MRGTKERKLSFRLLVRTETQEISQRPERTDSFSQRNAADSACKQDGDPTKGLTYEESGRNNGSKNGGRGRTGGLPKGSGGAYPIEMEVAI